MTVPIIHHPDFAAPLPAGHRFPMGKYGRLMEVLRDDGILARAELVESAEAPLPWIELVHNASYVRAVVEQTLDPELERRIGFPVTAAIARRARLSVGATVLGARLALEHGVACTTAGGSHHAGRAQGAGFCTFNDVAVAAHLLLADGEVSRVLIIDLDVHQGDGTAEICAGNAAIRTVSVHNDKNYPARKHPSSIDVALPDGVRDEAYLETLGWLLPQTIAGFSPDLVFYNAGVDPHADDRLGRLSLTDQGLKHRDRRVVSFFRERDIPVATVLGGGYGRDIDAVARRHLLTFEVASELV